MRDLRKKILLESGKTVSRKARARPDSNLGSGTLSPSSSPAGSRPASRAPSRYASEDDVSDSDTNDNLSSSLVASEDGEDMIKDWTDQLKDCINEIVDRKRSSVPVRQKYLAGFVHIARHHFADTIITNQLDDLVPALLRSIQGGRTTDEAVTAMKALQMVMVSTLTDDNYDQILSCLKTTCENSAEEKIKVEAIHTISVVIVFGGDEETAPEELMGFLLKIVETDGHSVEAGDNAPVVTAALEAWGFLASYFEDLEYESQAALEAFTEQLESSDPDVQMAAGTNIALIHEALRVFNKRCEIEHNERQYDLMEEARRRRETHTVEAYNPFSLQYDQHTVVQRMEELASDIGKSVSRKDKRNLRDHFNSILTSLRRGVGPKYSEAGRILRASDRNRKGERITEFEGQFKEFGYRESVTGPDGEEVIIKTWSILIRLRSLRRLLGGGFSIHWKDNPAMLENFGLDEQEI